MSDQNYNGPLLRRGDSDYLVSHGLAGEFGRFRAPTDLQCRRGDRVVLRTAAGLTIGTVMRPAGQNLRQLLDDGEAGEMLRRTSEEDESIALGIKERSQKLFADGRQLAHEFHLPLQIIDVEITLDGHHVTLYFLRAGECDERPLVAALSKKYEVMVALRDLALPAGATACGQPDCNQEKGGCTSCGPNGCSTGGCATGCGSKKLTREVTEYFAGLRQKMENRDRVPLV